MTARELIEKLNALVVSRPEFADRPVHLLSMDDDAWECTTVEVDCFDENVGWVVSLLAEKEKP